MGLGGHVLHTRHSHLSRPQNSETREDRTGQETPQTRYLGCAQSEHELLRRYPTATWSHTSSVAASHMAMMASSHAHGGICSNSKPMHDAIIYVLLFLGCLRSPGLTQKRRMSAHSPARTHTPTHTDMDTHAQREKPEIWSGFHPPSLPGPGSSPRSPRETSPDLTPLFWTFGFWLPNARQLDSLTPHPHARDGPG